MKLLKKISLFLILLIAVCGIVIWAWLHYLLPQYNGEIKLRGINNKVNVYFDDFAIPHIYAQSNEDAWHTLGYVHAQERLFQMELLRRVGAGRLSEIFGKDLIKADKLFRTLGIAGVAKKSAKEYFSNTNEQYQKLTLAYLTGINNYIEHGKTPIEFTLLGIKKEKFTVEDVYLISGYMAFSFAEAFRTDPLLSIIKNNLGENYLEDILLNDSLYTAINPVNKNDSLTRIYQTISQQISGIMQQVPAPPFIGSNAWVVAPKKSASGKALFANDTHIGYSSPCVWYEAHIQTPTDTIYGNFLAGFPFPLIGHTRHHAWGLTMFENDDINLYNEKLNPTNNQQYQFNNNWLPLTTRPETIQVKNEGPVTFNVVSTHNGPFVNQIVEEVDSTFTNPVSMYWIYNHFPATNIQAAFQMSFAKNIREMEAAASLINAPGLNLLYADAGGNIAWWAAAKILNYNKNVNTRLILDGTTSATQPVDTLPFTNNPHSINPPAGYIYSANNLAETLDENTIQGYYAPSDRAFEINKFLKEKNSFSLNDLKVLQTSATSTAKKQLAQIISSILEKQNTGSDEFTTQCLQKLKSWDGSHHKDSVSPTIFYTIFSYLMYNTMADELGSTNYNRIVNTHTLKNAYQKLISNPQSNWWNNINTPQQETSAQIILQSFQQSIALLKQKLGNKIQSLRWGNFHTLQHPHALGQQKPLDKLFNVGLFGMHGGNETVNNAGFNLDTAAQFKVKYGPAMRLLIDFNNIDSALSCLPTGQSGYFYNKHYNDQADLYVSNGYRLMEMRKGIIEKNKNTLSLIPLVK